MLVDILKPIFFLAPKLYNPPMYSNATESSTMVWICNFAKKCFDCKQCWDLICSFAEIAHDKWANVSDSLQSFRKNELMWAIHSGQMSECERFAQDKRATVSESLRTLGTNERSAQIAQCSWHMSKCEGFAQRKRVNERIAHKKGAI